MHAVAPRILSKRDPNSRFLVGCSTDNYRPAANGGASMSPSAALAQVESKCGAQGIHRDYASQTYTSTSFMVAQRTVDMDVPNKRSLRWTHCSWTPDAELLASENPENSGIQFSGFDPTVLQGYLAGTKTQAQLNAAYGTETLANINWLLTAPTWHKIVWTPWHEADNYQGSRTYGTDYAGFRHAFRVLADMVHAFNAPNWKTCLVLTAYAWKGNSGSSWNPKNFWPAWSGAPTTGNNYVDIMGVDVYNEGSLVSPFNWDSPSVSFTLAQDANDAAAYATRYGGSGTGYKTTDSGDFTWSGGFLGWCEAAGVTKWLIAELGCIRNIDGLTATWTGIRNYPTAGKADWLREMARFASEYSRSPAHNAKCFAIEYFMSNGRTYQGTDRLTTSIHWASDGTLVTGIIAEGVNTAARPTQRPDTTALQTGDRYLNEFSGNIDKWNGSAWAIEAAYYNALPNYGESWGLFWNEDGSGWDATNAAWQGWADVTAAYGAPV